jgi:hypothetical protein
MRFHSLTHFFLSFLSIFWEQAAGCKKRKDATVDDTVRNDPSSCSHNISIERRIANARFSITIAFNKK